MINKQGKTIIAYVCIACLFMGYVDAVIQPAYMVKSIIKIMLFIGGPCIYAYVFKTNELVRLFKYQRKGINVAVLFGIIIFIIIFVGYILFSKVFDFSGITASLTKNIGVSKDNFLYVSLYISLMNSLLEEFFFRGFGFIILQKHTSLKFAYLFSSLAFALYHIAMMIGWFDWYVFIPAIASLMIGGCIFNYVNYKYQSIYVSWFIHLSANVAINLIGAHLFHII